MKKPTVTATNHILPFGELSPAQFERLCLWLVEHEGYARAEHLGEAGSEQGRDVTAWRGTELWYFQCKRYQTISAQTLIGEVEKYNEHIEAGTIAKPHGIAFVTNAVLSAKARKAVETFCQTHGYESEFWARTELDLKVKKHDRIVKEFFNLNLKSQISNPQSISISRLPQLLTRDLFGRERELQMLDDAWANPRANLIVFVAFGGSGKSALVNRWMQRMAEENYRGAERVYAWSFWSQGSDQAQTSADPFIDAALRWFGDPDPTAGSPWEKGERLAQLIRQTRTLLILDGLEPLQHPRVPMEGRLKEQSMQALLAELAGSQPGLCIISTREQIADLHRFAPPAAVSHDLDQLSPQAGAQILRGQNIAGEADELEQAARDFGNHALALTILGSLLKNAYDGDIRRRKELAPLTEDEQNGGHARRVMTSYETWLSAAGEHSMLAVLRLLGLFNRPADARSLAALRAAPVIPGLTDGLQHLKEHEWRQTVAKLRRFKLLADADAGVATDFSLSPAPGQMLGQTKVRPTEELDAHALVREHFGQQMKRDHPDAWRAANLRLYEHLTTTAKPLPDTVEEMAPLFAAVAHGCEAGRHQQAFVDVYWRRIQRSDEFFSIRKLGAFGAALAALAGFFETPWRQPVAGLTEADQSFVLNAAGYDLRALGRLQEAAEPMQAGLQAAISRGDWKNAAISTGQLSELHLTIGDLPQALKFARQSVELADRSGDEFERIDERTVLADALHQVGQAEEAEAAFRQAEEMQNQLQPEYPILYSVQGFLYCDLLLGQGKHQEVKERAAGTIVWVKRENLLLGIALDNVSLGRACLLQSQQSRDGDYGHAAEFLQRAVDGLRQAGEMQFLPLGLLARAELRRVTGDYERAPILTKRSASPSAVRWACTWPIATWNVRASAWRKARATRRARLGRRPKR